MTTLVHSRRAAYLGALKFSFHGLLIEGVNRRVAWKAAKTKAADYTFHASNEHLKLWLQVW